MQRTMYKSTKIVLLAITLVFIVKAALTLAGFASVWSPGIAAYVAYFAMAVETLRVILIVVICILSFYWIPEILKRLFPGIEDNDLSDREAFR